MGHTNSTANLSLPQFIGTDKPTWLGDVNGAMSTIDAYAGTNDAAVAAVDAKADGAVSDAAGAVATATAANNTAGAASTTATNAYNLANNALTVANNADGHTNQLETKVGLLADLTTTDKTSIVNAINEVNAAVGTPTAAQVTYDNTGSGLTATNVQDAIDEVAQGGGGSIAWTQIGTATGTSSISIDLTGKNEILVSVHIGTAGKTNVVIPAAEITSSPEKYVSGYYIGAANFAGIEVNVSDSAVALQLAYWVSDLTSSSVTTVYAR